MDSDENLDFEDEFEERDDKQNEDDFNEDLNFGSENKIDEENFSDQDDEIPMNKKNDNQKKQNRRKILDDEETMINNEDDNEEIDYMSMLKNADENQQKNAREDFLNIIKNVGDDETIMKLIEERQQQGRTEAGEVNPNIIKEQMILERMLEKQKNIDQIMFEKEKLEFLKKTRKIRSNPEEYRNFIKCFVLCDIASTFYYLQSILDDSLLKSIILSQFSTKDLNFLLSMREQPDKYSIKSIIKTVNYHIQKYYVYKWKQEQVDFLKNLQSCSGVGYSQFTLIAMILYDYIGLKVRFTKIIDMRYLNLDKRHNFKHKESKRNSSESSNSGQKRSRENIINNIVASKKAARFSGMASRITANLMTQKNSSDSEEIDEEYQNPNEFSSQQFKESQKENNELFDSFMSSFKYDKKGNNNETPKKQQNMQTEDDSFASTAASSITNSFANPKKFDYRKYLKKTKMKLQINLVKQKNNKNKQKRIQFLKKLNLKQQINKIINQLVQINYLIELRFNLKLIQKDDVHMALEEDNQSRVIYNIDPFSFSYSKQKNTQKDQIQTQESKSSDSQIQMIIEQQEKTPQISHKSDFYQNSEIKYWLEVYDEKSSNWISFDPVQNEILEKFQIQMKQNGIPVLFIIGFNKLEFKNKNLNKYIYEKRSMKNMFLFDITDIHCERYSKIQVSRKELNFDFWWKNLLQHVSFLGDPERIDENYKQQIISERNLKFTTQKNQLPQSYPEFKASEIFVTKSMLQKYQSLRPNCEKTGFQFKDEDVYLKENVVDLHARTRWRILKRQVKKGEVPLKQVQSILGGQKMVDLFGEWQTEELIYKIGEDGTLPRNEYGNWEFQFIQQCKLFITIQKHNKQTFAVDPPEGTVLINLQGLPKLLKKHNIEYVEAISGFESSNQGRSHVVKQGVLAHSRDEERIRQLYQENLEFLKTQQAINLKKELLALWRKVFKGVLLKKSISDRINKIQN